MKNYSCFFLLQFFLFYVSSSMAQPFAREVAKKGPGLLTNIPGRKTTSLNGKWQILIDPNDAGERIGVNACLGWYTPFNGSPADYVWVSGFNKPLIMSEFGGEALYGHHSSADTSSSWSEEYQERLYKDKVTMFKNIPFLRGTTPWVLYDFRSVNRMHSVYQKGFNRKGLLSEKGKKKKAWYVMADYYKSITY